jgi:hypothetical protein
MALKDDLSEKKFRLSRAVVGAVFGQLDVLHTPYFKICHPKGKTIAAQFGSFAVRRKKNKNNKKFVNYT